MPAGTPGGEGILVLGGQACGWYRVFPKSFVPGQRDGDVALQGGSSVPSSACPFQSSHPTALITYVVLLAGLKSDSDSGGPFLKLSCFDWNLLYFFSFQK